MESWPWPSLDSFSVPFAKQFLRLNLLMITLPFDLVIDLLQMVYIAMGMHRQRSKRVEWAVLSLLILSLTYFSMGRSTTFLSAQHCADIFPRYPPCQLAFLFIAVIELLHACVRWTSALSSLLPEALQITHSLCCTLVH